MKGRLMLRSIRGSLKPGSIFLMALCWAIALWTLLVPVDRCLRWEQVSFNEGWNVYNAQRVALHQSLYAKAYDWTTVNYPALSFHIIATLNKLTGEYLFTARILSLISLFLCGLFAGLIVKQMTRSTMAAWLSGLLFVSMIGAIAEGYVAMDDPLLLALAFSLAGLYVYLKGNRQGWALACTALLFVLGGNIKHNLIEFPIAVLLDLLILAPRRALKSAAGGLLLVAVSLLLTRWVDGPELLACLLAPRGYSAVTGLALEGAMLMLALLPAVGAVVMACFCWKNAEQRIFVLLLISAVIVNAIFCGGSGCFISGTFGSICAIALLDGLFLVEYSSLPLGQAKARSPLVVASVFFLWMVIPILLLNHWRTDAALRENRDKEQRFAQEVQLLKAQPGPSLCESLLLCYYAGKPYIYDPFNATRFVYLGKLDPEVIAERVRNREFGSIELDYSLDVRFAASGLDQRFAKPILIAISQNYHPALSNQDGTIYLPNQELQHGPR
jgi:4-amino-4-deoxy-L-arabinose transferase-like glycosyltransferase